MELTRINNDVNGNPRYVVHFLELVNDVDDEQAKAKAQPLKGIYSLELLYDMAVKKAKQIGGRKYHTKSYGGGIVFQSYNTTDLIKRIEELKSK